MQTATQQGLKLDLKRNRARQYATMLIHELQERGHIAPSCRSEAIYDLTELFYKEGVEITTDQQRHLTKLSRIGPMDLVKELMHDQRDLRAAQEEAECLRGALQECLAIAEIGVPPSYGRYLSSFERIAEICRKALS